MPNTKKYKRTTPKNKNHKNTPYNHRKIPDDFIPGLYTLANLLQDNPGVDDIVDEITLPNHLNMIHQTVPDFEFIPHQSVRVRAPTKFGHLRLSEEDQDTIIQFANTNRKNLTADMGLIFITNYQEQHNNKFTEDSLRGHLPIILPREHAADILRLMGSEANLNECYRDLCHRHGTIRSTSDLIKILLEIINLSQSPNEFLKRIHQFLIHSSKYITDRHIPCHLLMMNFLKNEIGKETFEIIKLLFYLNYSVDNEKDPVNLIVSDYKQFLQTARNRYLLDNQILHSLEESQYPTQQPSQQISSPVNNPNTPSPTRPTSASHPFSQNPMNIPITTAAPLEKEATNNQFNPLPTYPHQHHINPPYLNNKSHQTSNNQKTCPPNTAAPMEKEVTQQVQNTKNLHPQKIPQIKIMFQNRIQNRKSLQAAPQFRPRSNMKLYYFSLSFH